MFGLDPRLEAIIEIVLLLTIAAFIGWVLGRLVLAGRLKALRAAVSEKADELETCRWGKIPGLARDMSGTGTPRPAPKGNREPLPENREEPVRPEPVLMTPPAFVHADPLLPAIAPDDTPDLIPVASVPSEVSPIPRASTIPEPTAPVGMNGVTGNSEAAVLNRIAARASEVNFDRIGRATAREADDLKDIVGIGPFLERKLHTLGIYTFRQIANFTKEDIDKVNELIEFFPGRIERDNWVEQSKEFYKRKSV